MITTTKIVLLNSEWKEYVVKVYEDGKRNPAADYFTPDKDDAEATAKAIEQHANRNQEA